jgi:mono/diheme cytochrome c family protein
MLKTGFVLIALFVLTACAAGDGGPTATPTETPTPFPTFAFTQPTEAPQVLTAAARAAEENDEGEELDPVAVERGLDRYLALECAECHGEGGVGGDEEGTSLLAYDASEDAFIDFMRTGGEMGDDHRFPAEVLSNSGISNLYQYVISLNESAESE